jgi:methionyl-tRNA formyltransferase
MRILFLTKRKPLAEDAAELIMLHSNSAEIIYGNINDPFPEHILSREFDYVISYISPWIIPKVVLDNAKIAAINFHPGPPEYPGIGCTNFAIYNGEKEYGITVHHMNEKVDTGDIITVERFPILEQDTVYTLTQRCYAYIFVSFCKILPQVLADDLLGKSNEKWKRKPFTRGELNWLCVISKDMTEDEIERRLKATTYPGKPGAYIV